MDTIARFLPDGILLDSGTKLSADVIVTATGLKVQLLGGVPFIVNGVPVRFADRLQDKGVMFDDLPNVSFTFIYTNASWTLAADLVAAYVCRLLHAMRQRDVRQATPRTGAEEIGREPFAALSSGYIRRVADELPKQGSRRPWRLNQNYALDLVALRFGSVDDDMEFGGCVTTAGRSQ